MEAAEQEQRRNFTLLQEDILPKLGKRDFFKDVVTHNYILTAHCVGMFPICSPRRIVEAFGFWRADVDRTLYKGIAEGSPHLDHFKHASFIAFWLRRLNPINEIRIISPHGTDLSDERAARRERYLRYGNELSAFLVGYKICVNYEIGETFAKSDLAVIGTESKSDYIKRFELPDNLLDDYLMLWKHKNMSPYAFYLMYKSLFQSHGGRGLGLAEK